MACEAPGSHSFSVSKRFGSGPWERKDELPCWTRDYCSRHGHDHEPGPLQAKEGSHSPVPAELRLWWDRQTDEQISYVHGRRRSVQTWQWLSAAQWLPGGGGPEQRFKDNWEVTRQEESAPCKQGASRIHMRVRHRSGRLGTLGCTLSTSTWTAQNRSCFGHLFLFHDEARSFNSEIGFAVQRTLQ